MIGASGKGLVFEYDSGSDEDLNGTAKYWPMEDTIVNNIITSNSTGIVCTSIPDASNSYNLAKYLIEGNTITVNNNATNGQSCLWLNNCGISVGNGFQILRNKFISGYAGIYINTYGQHLTIANNYFCTRYGLYHNIYDGLDWENVFVHNSVYSDESCLYFIGESQDDWDIRNNILYTKGVSSGANPSACINIQSYNDIFDQVEFTNGNLFYVPNGAFIGIKDGIGYSTLAGWQSSSADVQPGSSNNDPNSVVDIAPNFANLLNCNLDLKQDLTSWPGAGFPNSGQTIPNTSITLGAGQNLVQGDIKGVFNRSGWTIGAFDAASQGLLPVQLITFYARLNAKRVLLDWQTASELNSSYFDVEKSKDGVSGWAFVSRVQSRGNSNVRADYNSIDHKPYGGVSYYRLKQVDQDGRVVYSQVRKIVNETKTLTVYPNPASDHVILEGLDKNRSNTIRLLDVTGKLLFEDFIKDSQHRIDLSQLQPGVYHVVVNGNEHFQLVKKQ
jgi:hypothetical protein